MSARARRLRLQIGVVVCASLPLLGLIAGFLRDDLGANPIETITHVTGDWTLRFLLLCLAITPARRWLGLAVLAPLRRTLGLTAFVYACLHLLTYVGLDQFFDGSALLEDVLERRFVTAGFAAFLCLVPLAITSTRRWHRRLGRRWVSLHRLVYLTADLGGVHYVWLTKADLRAPLVHAAILAILLLARVPTRRAPRTAAASAR